MVKIELPSGECKKLSGPNPTNDADLDVIEPTNTTRGGVRINYKNGDPTYKLTVDIMCTDDEYKYNDFIYNSTEGVMNININFSSRVGCAYD
jgi:hypothetical protein